VTDAARRDRARQAPTEAIVALGDEQPQDAVTPLLAPTIDTRALLAVPARRRDLKRRAQPSARRDVIRLDPDVAGPNGVDELLLEPWPMLVQSASSAAPKPDRVRTAYPAR